MRMETELDSFDESKFIDCNLRAVGSSLFYFPKET